MRLPADLLTWPAEEAARLVALRYVQRARAAARRLRRGEGPDPLHDYRVEVRRVRSLLRAWRRELRGTIRKKHRKALAQLQSSTGGGRDFEVAAEWIQGRLGEASPEEQVGQAWLVADFESRHLQAMDDVQEQGLLAFDRLSRKLRKRLRRSHTLRRPERSFAEALVGTLRAHMDQVILHLAKVRSLEDIAQAHVARIRVKRLRYLVEPLEDVLPEAIGFGASCKRLQEVLGDLNDTRVLRAELVETAPPQANAGDLEAGLAGLRRETASRQSRLFSQLQEEWLAGSAAPLREQVNQMTMACATAGPAPVEIERKFLLRALPSDMPVTSLSVIEQGWLPGTHPRLRLRARSDENGRTHHTRTLKSGPGLERVELEERVRKRLFTILWPLTEGARVHKRRHVAPVGAHVWEIDEFLDRDGLLLAEVELRARDEHVEVPAWLAPVLVREVTGDASFTNQALSR